MLNKVLAKRMQLSLKISDVQRAFRPVDGTFENITIIETLIKDSKANMRELRVASLDIRKAFDMVGHSSILDTLRHRGYPKLFVQYVENLYRAGTTIIESGTSKKTISPTRGVRQGDPLSPLMFNLVIDDVLSALEVEGCGYKLSESSHVCAMGFADDLFLVAETKLALQHLLDKATPLFRDRGLEINGEKSFTISFIPKGKDKKIKVGDRPEFRVDGNLLAYKDAFHPWKYLGVPFDDLGRMPAAVDQLKTLLGRVSSAPLRPHQRLVILKQFLIPRFIHRLVAGPCPAAGRLEKLDLMVRKTVKGSWLKLESSVPNGFLYSHISHGGLDLPCFQTLIPRLRLGRMSQLMRSEYGVIKWLCTTECFQKDLAKTRKLCCSLKTPIENAKQETKYWASRLHNTYDGSHLKYAQDVPYVHSWLKGMPYLSGKEYINLLKVRINALPTRARMARGRPGYARECRHGCGQVEFLLHVSQLCDQSHRMTCKRHDDLCAKVAKVLGARKNYTVKREFVLKPVDRPRLRPDLVVITPSEVWVLDAQVIGTNRCPSSASKYKIDKYNKPWLSDLLPHPERPRFFGSITVSMSGIWAADSANDLICLGISRRTLVDLTVQVVQGTLRVFRGHQDHKSFRWKSGKSGDRRRKGDG